MSTSMADDHEDSSSSDSLDDGEEYRTDGLKKLSHGYNFQLHVSAVVILRALETTGLVFRASVEEATAGKFDDLIIRMRDSGAAEGITSTTLMQMKHVDMESPTSQEKSISAKEFRKIKGKFSLQEYFPSFREVYAEFSKESMTLKHCVIVTNLGFKEEDECNEWVEVEKDASGREVVDGLLGVRLWRFRTSFEGRQELIRLFRGPVKGKKVELDKYANLFLEKLRFAVDMSECKELKRLEREILRKNYPTHRRRLVYETFSHFMHKWLFSEKGMYLTDEKIRKHLEGLRNKFGVVRLGVLDPVRNFTGRVKELDEIKGLRVGGEKVVAICGMGGIGKTQLAMKFLEKLMINETSAIWVDCRSKETMKESFCNLASILGVSQIGGMHEVDFGVLLERIAGCFQKRNCILVMDNVKCPEMIYEESLLSVFPENCFFLITSRDKRWGQIKVLDLEVMTKEDARSLLKESLTTVDEEENEDDLAKLAEELGYLPLALQQAIAFLNTLRRNNHYLSSEDIKTTCSNVYQSHMWPMLEQPVEKSLGDNYQETVASTWTQSIDDINQIQSYSTAVPLFNTVGYLSPKKTWVDELKAIARDVKSNLHSDLLALNDCSMINLCRGQIACHILLQAVVRSRLLREQKQLDVLKRALDAFEGFKLENRAYIWEYSACHNELYESCSNKLRSLMTSLIAVQKYCKAMKIAKVALEKFLNPISSSESQMRKRVLFCIKALTFGMNGVFFKLSQLKTVVEHERRHPFTWIHNPSIIRKSKIIFEVQEICDSIAESNVLNSEQVVEMKLKKEVYEALIDEGMMNEMVKILKHWMEQTSDKIPDEHILALESTARIHWMLGMLQESLNYYEELEEHTRKNHPKNYLALLEIISNKICILFRLERSENAESLFPRVEAYVSSISGNESGVLETLKDVAENFLFHGVFDMAMKTYLKLKSLQENIPEKIDIQDRLETRCSIADLLHFLNRQQDALKELQGIQEDHVRLLGMNDIRLIETKKVIVACLLKMNKVSEALRVCEELSKHPFYKSSFGDSETIIMKLSIGQYLLNTGEPGRALEIFEETYESVVKNVGPDHDESCKIEEMIGVSLMNLGEHKRAKDIFQRLYERHDLLKGFHGGKSANCSFLYATCLFECREVENALEIFRKNIDILSQPECKNEYDAMIGQFFVGRCLLKLGDLQSALDIFKDVCTKNLQSSGSISVHVLGVNEFIGDILLENGLYVEARDVYKKVYEERLRKHLELWHTQYKMGKCLLALGENKGLKLMEIAYESKISSLGVDRPEVLNIQFDLGVTLVNHSEMLDKANNIFQELHDRQSRILGVDHIETLDIKLMIGMCNFKSKQVLKAKVIFEEIHAKAFSTLGNGHSITLRALFMIATCLLELGDYSNALEYFQEIYEVRTIELGREHNDTVSARKLLALCLLKMNRQMDALGHMKGVVESSSKMLGGAHPETVNSRLLVADLLANMLYNEEAMDTYLEVRRIKALSLSSEETLTIDHKIGNLHKQMGEHEESLKVLLRVLNLRSLSLGEDHQDVLRTRFDIGKCLFVLGKLEEALKKFEDVHRNSCESLGVDHRLTMEVKMVIGSTLCVLGDSVKGLKELSGLHKRMVRVFGRKDILTLQCLFHRGIHLLKTGEYGKALKCLEETHAGLQRIAGDDNFQTVQALYGIVQCKYHLGLKENDAILIQELYERRRFLTDPPDFSIYHNIGVLLSSVSEYTKALEISMECYEYRTSSLGQEHELTRDSKRFVGMCHFNMREYSECLKVFKEIGQVSQTGLNQAVCKVEELRGMGLKLVHQGKTQTALRFFTEAYERVSSTQGMETSVLAAELYSYLLIYRKEAGCGFLRYRTTS